MKIGFCGTMSVGKTTLVKELKKLGEFKDHQFVTERSQHLMNQGIPLNTDSTLKGQTVFLAERSLELLQENIVTDRTIIDVISFAKCSKSMDYIEKEEFINLASYLIPEYDYIFYISPEGVEIEDNGVREIDSKYRNEIDFTIIRFLDKYHQNIKNLIRLEGTTEERIELFKEALLPQYL